MPVPETVIWPVQLAPEPIVTAPPAVAALKVPPEMFRLPVAPPVLLRPTASQLETFTVPPLMFMVPVPVELFPPNQNSLVEFRVPPVIVNTALLLSPITTRADVNVVVLGPLKVKFAVPPVPKPIRSQPLVVIEPADWLTVPVPLVTPLLIRMSLVFGSLTVIFAVPLLMMALTPVGMPPVQFAGVFQSPVPPFQVLSACAAVVQARLRRRAETEVVRMRRVGMEWVGRGRRETGVFINAGWVEFD